jgi:hypothetical protein
MLAATMDQTLAPPLDVRGAPRAGRSSWQRPLMAVLCCAASALQPVMGCDCFPLELRLKTAQDALQTARVAVYGRVVEVAAEGARLRVLESFKGPGVDAVVDIGAAGGSCPSPPALVVGEEALLLSFGDGITACDKHPREHYLVETFRSLAAKAR